DAARARRGRGRLRERRELGALAPRGLAVHQPRPHHLPPPHARGRVGLPRGGDLGRAAWRGRRREPPVGRARPDRPRDPEPAPRSGALRGCDDVNLWAAVILAALLLDFAVERLADVLDLGRLGRTPLAAVGWLFAAAGARAWLWCWLASALYLIGVQVIAPSCILPLFNRFTPLPEGRLREAILAYARAVGFPLEDVFVIDGSRRSTRGNAFFTGFGRHKRVALFDTRIERLEPDELVAVLAHEVGHYRRGHVVIGLG